MSLSLSEYEDCVFSLADILRSAEYILEKEDSASNKECRDLLKRIAENRFNIVVAGRYNRGKSTLVNAILGSDYLPTSILPLTSVITAVRFGNRERVILYYDYPRLPLEIRLSAIGEHITEEGNPGNQDKIRVAQIEVPAEILRHDYFFVDTPGLASPILENTRTAENFLPEIDALVLVTSFDSPLSQEESSFLEKALLMGVRRIFLVVNKLDLITQEDEASAMAFIQNRCTNLNLKNISIFPVSARQGLAAKQATNSHELRESRLDVFEQHLVNFAIHDKANEFLILLAERVQTLLQGFSANERIASLLKKARQISLTILESIDSEILERPGKAQPSISKTGIPSACEICATILNHTLNYFSQFQLDINASETTRALHTDSRGLCSLHTWQYDRMASPRGTAAGYYQLLLSISKELITASDALDMSQLKTTLMKCLATYSQCAACKLRASVETEMIEKFKSLLKTSTDMRDSSSLCLPHLIRLALTIEDPVVRKDLLAREAQLLHRIAEEMQRYAMRYDALRRDLITKEQNISPRLALEFLTGNKYVDALWFVNGDQT